MNTMKIPRSFGRSTISANNQGQMTMILLVLIQLVHFVHIGKVFCESSVPNVRQHILRNYTDDRAIDLFQELSKTNKSIGSNISNEHGDIDRLESVILPSQYSFFNSTKIVVQNNTNMYSENRTYTIETLPFNTESSTDWESSFLINNQDYSMSFTPQELFTMNVNHKISQDIDMDPCKSGIIF